MSAKSILTKKEILESINRHIDTINNSLSLLRVGINTVDDIDNELDMIDELFKEIYKIGNN